MPSFKMTDLMQGLKDGTTVPQQYTPENQGRGRRAVGERPFQEHRSREETETLIKNFLAEQGKPVTINPISRAIKRTVSPGLRRILAGMVEAGEIVETTHTVPNGFMVRYWYSLPDKK